MASQRDKGGPRPGRIHNRLCWILVSVLVGLVLVFDLLSVYAREFMGAPVMQGSVISIGIVVALCIILVILAAALHYVLRVNAACRDPQEPGHHD